MSAPKKILIVDDEPDVVKWLSLFFEESGFKPITAYNGTDGFSKARNELPDVITLDITMPEESGVRMYRKLHEDKSTSNIPVIILTGISSDFKKFISTRKQVPEPSAYFEKPVNKDKLLEKVKELVG